MNRCYGNGRIASRRIFLGGQVRKGAIGLLGAGVFLLLYQVFPTLAAFAGWNRGMVLLALGVITLAVLINLQNRSLRRRSVSVAAMILMSLWPSHAGGADVQVVLPS